MGVQLIIPAPLVEPNCLNPKPSLIYTVGVRPEKAPVFEFKLYTLTNIFLPFIYLLGNDDLFRINCTMNLNIQPSTTRFRINCTMQLEHTTQYNHGFSDYLVKTRD